VLLAEPSMAAADVGSSSGLCSCLGVLGMGWDKVSCGQLVPLRALFTLSSLCV
jgi:hypothetical protein